MFKKKAEQNFPLIYYWREDIDAKTQNAGREFRRREKDKIARFARPLQTRLDAAAPIVYR
jgi:hypothetical protein